MAKSKVVQVPCESNLYQQICTFRQENNMLTDANAVRELIAIGLRTVRDEQIDGKPTNRELLESIHFHVTKNNRSLEIELD